eukprot:jgi/Galph1/2695/GphlegSOOS_G1336.1
MTDPYQRFYYSQASTHSGMPPGNPIMPPQGNIPMVYQPAYPPGYAVQPGFPPGMAPTYGMPPQAAAYSSLPPNMYSSQYFAPPMQYYPGGTSMRPNYSTSKSLVPAQGQQGPTVPQAGQLVPYQDKDVAVHKAKEDMKSLEGEIARYKSENSSLRMKVTRTEENLKKINEEIESLKTQFSAAHSKGPRSGVATMSKEEKEFYETSLKGAEERNERLRQEVVRALDMTETQKALESLEQKFDVLERRLISKNKQNTGDRHSAIEQLSNMNQLGEISGALRGLRLISESSLKVSKERDGTTFGQREELQEIMSHLSSLEVRVAELVSFVSNQLKASLEAMGVRSTDLPSLSGVQNISAGYAGGKTVEMSPNLQRRTRSISDSRKYSDDYGLKKDSEDRPSSPRQSPRGITGDGTVSLEHSSSSLSGMASSSVKQSSLGFSSPTEGSGNQLPSSVKTEQAAPRQFTSTSPNLRRAMSPSMEAKQASLPQTTLVEDVTSDLVDLGDLDISEQKKK